MMAHTLQLDARQLDATGFMLPSIFQWANTFLSQFHFTVQESRLLFPIGRSSP